MEPRAAPVQNMELVDPNVQSCNLLLDRTHEPVLVPVHGLVAHLADGGGVRKQLEKQQYSVQLDKLAEV